MSEFLVFRRFNDQEDALNFSKRLTAEGILNQMEDNSMWLDKTFGGGGEASTEYTINIQKVDFEKAQAIMEQEAQALIEGLPDDYYLFEFSDDELYEILLQREKWSEFDVELAKKLLAGRGKEVDLDLVEALRKQRFDDLAKTEESPNIWIFAGYFFAILWWIFRLVYRMVLVEIHQNHSRWKESI